MNKENSILEIEQYIRDLGLMIGTKTATAIYEFVISKGSGNTILVNGRRTSDGMPEKIPVTKKQINDIINKYNQ